MLVDSMLAFVEGLLIIIGVIGLFVQGITVFWAGTEAISVCFGGRGMLAGWRASWRRGWDWR
jgi:hypothetical protein